MATQPGIKSITVSGCVPLYDTIHDTTQRSSLCYFAVGPFQIFEKAAPNKTIITPAAVSDTSATLTVVFENVVLGQHQVRASFKLSKQQSEQDFLAAIPITLHAQTIQFSLKRKAGPLALVGTIRWQIGDKAGKKWTDFTTPIELYCLSSSIPPFVRNFGIPLSLLRQEQFFLKWMSSETATWEEHVISTLCTYQLWYEVVSGSPKYTTLLTQRANFPGPATICWLDLWLSDMDGLKDRKDTTTKYTVNCYDLASLSYIFLTLGVSDYSAIRMKFMEPFGYIKETTLIGRGRSNNPVFKDGRNLIGDNEGGRRGFDNHLFLAKHTHLAPNEPFVLDACCGPAVGSESLTQYIQGAIEGDHAMYHTELGQRPGDLHDVVDGPGVTCTASSLALTLPAKFPQAAAPKEMVIHAPFIGSPGSNDRVMATWTVMLKLQQQHRISVTVCRFKDSSDAEDTYSTRARKLLGHGKPLPNKKMCCEINNGAVSLACDKKYGFLVTIESDTLGEKELEQQADVLWKHFFSLILPSLILPVPPPEPPKISNLETPRSKIVVGGEFSITLYAEPNNVGSWRGYQVTTSTGCALRMRSTVTKEKDSVVFTFLARKAGWEFITLTVYSADLAMVSQVVSLLIGAVPLLGRAPVPQSKL